MGVIPRLYQTEATTGAREAIAETGRALVVIASGLGKTLTSAFVWHGFRRGRGIFLVHSNDILDHAIGEYTKVFNGVKMALFNGFNKEIGGADIIFTTFQTMIEHLDEFSPDEFAWMTVDETQHSMAKTYREVIEHFSCDKLGITATPDRTDLLDIREIFGQEAYSLPLEEAIARGMLPPIEYHLLTEEGFDQEELERLAYEVIEDGRRVSLAQINSRLFIPARDEVVARRIEEYEDDQTIVFCKTIEHTMHFMRFLKNSATYHSEKFRKDKKKVMELFRQRELRRVLAVDCFNEGVDFPDVSLVVFYRTTESDTVFRQQLGRGLRPGKDKLVVLDFVGNLERVLMLKRMAEEIARYQELHRKTARDVSEEMEREWNPGEVFNLVGDSFKFNFSDSLVDLMKVLDTVQMDFYGTWQEAAKAAKALGIKKTTEYVRNFKKDPKLPSSPRMIYDDFPGWPNFLDFDAFNPYTYEEASKRVRELKISQVRPFKAYVKQEERDKRIPASPDKTYEGKGWTTWNAFFGKGELYSYEEASKAARELGIKGFDDYVAYTRSPDRDMRFPTAPSTKYKGCGWTGWPDFLGRGDLRGLHNKGIKKGSK